ncbi:hypothetical protein FIBSPDRAFT_693472, partial [Athelia psychrophila]
MLPYSVKLAWMILCTLGAVCSWPVLWCLAEAIDSWWVPAIYGGASTIFVLFFDLGTIWKMDPSNFPLSFCLMQMVVRNLMALVIINICGVYHIATIRSALWPQHGKRGIQWDNTYLLLFVALPIASTALQMGFAIKYGAYKQAGFDGIACMITEPLWPRLLGYGGLPLILAVASAVFTAFAVGRL